MTDQEKGVILRCLLRAALAYRKDAVHDAPEYSQQRWKLAEEAKELAERLKLDGWKFD